MAHPIGLASLRDLGTRLALISLLVLSACRGNSSNGPDLTAGAQTLLGLSYGRLVDVYGQVSDSEGETLELFAEDVLIGPDIQDSPAPAPELSFADFEYRFDGQDPDTLQPRLVIPKEIGSPEFEAAFDALDDLLTRIEDEVAGVNASGIDAFSVVPRNAAIRLLFSQPLEIDSSFFYDIDANTAQILGLKNDQAVQLLARHDPDSDWGRVPSRYIIRGNEIILDPVLIGAEGDLLQVSNSGTGMPTSRNQQEGNMRLAVATEGPQAIPGLRVGSRSDLTGPNPQGLRSVLRDFRAANASDSSLSILGGFVRDPRPPRLIGEMGLYLERVDQVNARLHRLTLYKNGIEHDIDRGDVLHIIDPGTGKVFARRLVLKDLEDDRGRPEKQHVRVLIRRVPRLENIDPSNQPGYPADLAEREAWLRQNAPPTTLFAEFTAQKSDPQLGFIWADDPINFIRFSPEPLPLADGSPSPSHENVSPFASAGIRLSKPVDMATVRSLDSFFLATRNVLDRRAIIADFVGPRQIDVNLFFAEYADKYITPHLLVSQVFDHDGSQNRMSLQPSMGMYLDEEMRQTDEGRPFMEKRFPYFLHLVGGEQGIRDLAGNELDLGILDDSQDFVAIPFSLDTRMQADDPSKPLYEDNLIVHVARRFADADEDEQPSVYLKDEMPLASGQNRAVRPHLLARTADTFGDSRYLEGGLLQGRETSRERKIVDDLNQQQPPDQGQPLGWSPSLFAQPTVGQPTFVQASASTPFFNPPYVDPFNPAGSRLQVAWREVDLSLSRRNPRDFNLDVEQMYWAPYSGAPFVAAEFPQSSLFLGHAEQRPDPAYTEPNTMTYFAESGQRVQFADNYAHNLKAGNNLEKDSPPPPHAAYEDRTVVLDPGQTIAEPNGVNRYLPLPAFQEPYFVWRDETVTAQGGEVGFVNPDAGFIRPGDTVYQRYPPYVLSPFLGGSGRRITKAANGSPVINDGFFSNANGMSLQGRLSDPSRMIGSSRQIENSTGGTLPSIALPLLADFQTLPNPDLQALGESNPWLRSWQSSRQHAPPFFEAYPFFRSFSTGFIGSNPSETVLVQPGNENWERASGGSCFLDSKIAGAGLVLSPA